MREEKERKRIKVSHLEKKQKPQTKVYIDKDKTTKILGNQLNGLNRVDLKELFEKYKGSYRGEEYDWGRNTGKEIW